jgi:hypothetical protein
MTRSCLRALLGVIFCMLMFGGSLYGQQFATLNVTVQDQSGGVIPNASVSVRNRATDATRSETTSDAGVAVIPGLAAGNYEMTVTSGQFTPYKADLVLTVGQLASQKVTLGLSVTEKVEVHATTQGIDTQKTEVSQVIERQEILDLPISGRDFIDFVLLTPSANVGRSTAVGAQSPFTETVLEISFAGLRETHSTFFGLDGIDYTTSISGVQRTSPSQDWVQEFRVIDSPYTGENGRNLGSVVETITKSGSNDLHGSVYEFFRNNVFDANNALSAPGFNTLRSNQFGATLGGPVIKDKSFFYGGYEGQRRAESPIYSSFIIHCIDNPCLGGTESINQVKEGLGLSPENLGSILQIDNYDKFILKSSNVLSDKTNVNISYLYTDDRKQNAPGAAPGEGLPSAFRDNPVLDQTIYGNIEHVFSNTMTSETVIDYGRRTFNLNPVGAGFEPAVNIPDLLSSGGFVGSVHFYREQNFQVAENLTKVHGNHTFKFGGDIEPTWISVQATLFSPGFAVFTPQSFFGVAPFTAPPFGPGTPVEFLFLEPRELFGEQIPQRTLPFEAGLYAGPSEAAFNQGTSLSFEHTLFSLYGQDQWRVNPNLSLTFGLRYDVDAMPSGRTLKLDGAGHYTNYRNVQPRFGFSYAMRDSKTVIRGGAGIFTGPFDYSDVLVSWIGASEFTYMNQPLLKDFSDPTRFLIGTGASGAVGISGPVAASPAFSNFTHNGIYPSPTDPTAPLNQFPLGYATRKFQNAYAEQANLQVENQIAKDTFVSVSYQWVHALRLPVYSSINGLPAGTTPSGVQAFTPADPNFGFSLIVAPVGYSNYNGGTVAFRKNFSNHYSIFANYTYSKSIDISTDVQLAATPYNYLNPGLDRARGDNDVTHRFILTGLVETPSTWNVFARDFKCSMLNTLQSPRYYTVLAGFDVNGDQYPFSDRVGTIGRNTYRGDSFYNTDIRVSRDVPINERVKAEFSAEVFNLFNRANVVDIDHVYGSPLFDAGPIPTHFGDGVTSLENPTFGTPKYVAPARQIQLSVRLTF